MHDKNVFIEGVLRFLKNESLSCFLITLRCLFVRTLLLPLRDETLHLLIFGPKLCTFGMREFENILTKFQTATSKSILWCFYFFFFFYFPSPSIKSLAYDGRRNNLNNLQWGCAGQTYQRLKTHTPQPGRHWYSSYLEEF